MRFFLTITLLIASIQSNAADKSVRLSEADNLLIARCSQAAFIVVYATDTIRNDVDRLRLVLGMQKDLQASQRLGKATPTVAEVISAFGAVGTLLMLGTSKDTAQGHDTLVGQAAATCALKMKAD